MAKIDKTVKAKVLQSPANGRWTSVVMSGSADFFGTRGVVKVRGSVDDVAFKSAFIALGDGRHKLPIAVALLKAIGVRAGERVTVHLQERIGATRRKNAADARRRSGRPAKEA